MRLRGRLLAVCISFTLITTLCPSAFAQGVRTEHVNINGVVQAKSNWCWAACAETVGTTLYPSSQRDQYDVVKYIKGTPDDPYPNVPGYTEDSAEGSEYVTYNRFQFGRTTSPFSFLDIESDIADGFPIQASAGYYSGSARSGGHVVVIYMTQNFDYGEQYINYFDPWDGMNHVCTYSSFCDGSYNGRQYNYTIFVS